MIEETNQTFDDDILLLDDDDDFDLEILRGDAQETNLTKAASVPMRSDSLIKTQKKSTWINPSFDDFGGDFRRISGSTASRSGTSTQTLVSRRRTRHAEDPVNQRERVKPSSPTSDLWVEKYKPKSAADLAVHKKKISEVQEWIETNAKHQAQQGAPMLLLTGPAGSGKSATIYALADEMNIDIKEWANPTAENTQRMNPDRYNGPEFVPVGGSAYESQSSQFTDFLLRANRYPSLQMLNLHSLHSRLILVEEYPNVFFSQTRQFHDVLRKYRQQGQSPLVFIVSDSAGGDGNERLLFPKDVQAELQIKNISFNPVAPTSLSKVLQRIASVESSQYRKKVQTIDKATLDSLIASCSGDIRGAINALQFTCRQGIHGKEHTARANNASGKGKSSKVSRSTSAKKHKSTGSRSKKSGEDGEGDNLAAIGARDTSLFLFRALGKILYCKRETEDTNNPKLRLPAHLSHYHRLPLQFNPEDVIEKSQVSGEFFVSYLHQNYLDFFPVLEDVIRATDYLSDADHLTTNWTSRQTLRAYAASVAARGLIHSNSTKSGIGGSTSSGSGWKPLHKPQWFAVNKQMRENINAAKSLFRDCHSTPEELQTQMLPYMAKARTRLSKPGQGCLLQEITRFTTSKNSRSERLDEKDVGNLSDEEDSVTPSAVAADTNPADINDLVVNDKKETETEDEEIVIEEFDD